MLPPNRSECWRLPTSHKWMCLKSTTYSWFFHRRICYRILSPLSIQMSRSYRNGQRRSRVIATSSEQAFVLVGIWYAASNLQHSPQPSKSTSQMMQCRRVKSRKDSPVKCSTAAKTSSNLTRNSTSPRNRPQSTFSNPSSALLVLVASRLSHSKPSKHNPSLTKQIPLLILLLARRTFDPFTLNVSTANSFLIIPNSHSSSTGMDGVRDQIGELIGKANHRVLRYLILGYWLLRQILLRLGILIPTPCILFRTRILGCCIPARER